MKKINQFIQDRKNAFNIETALAYVRETFNSMADLAFWYLVGLNSYDLTNYPKSLVHIQQVLKGKYSWRDWSVIEHTSKVVILNTNDSVGEETHSAIRLFIHSVPTDLGKSFKSFFEGMQLVEYLQNND